MGRRKPTFLSLTSFFCGAGGDTQGAAMAGLMPTLAINHWRLAIDSHAANFPSCAHDCRDISQTHPSRYGSTHLAWFSPECTTWSQARGKKRNFTGQLAIGEEFEPLPTEAEERSRVQMWDVVAYSEYHDYEAVIVENVVDQCAWGLLPAWYDAMDRLGYRMQMVMLNSMFTGVPQSRDRVYWVFTKKGNPKPDLEVRPMSWCPRCETSVEGVQSFKKPSGPRVGRYRQQYVFRCPSCAGVMLPFVNPAASAIDWALPIDRIGDRKKPLAKATMARIQAGIDKYWAAPAVFDTLRDPKIRDTAGEPLPTQTGRQSQAMYLPLLTHFRGDSAHWQSSVRTVLEEMGTITADGNHHGLLQPLFIKNFTARGNPGQMAHRTTEPLGTITGSDHHSLLEPPLAVQAAGNTYDGASGAGNDYVRIRPVDGHPLWSLPGTAQTGLVVTNQWGNRARPAKDEPLPTATTGNTTGLVVPINGGRHGEGEHKVRSTADPLLTQTGDLARALVYGFYGRQQTSRPAAEPFGTQRGQPTHALLKGPADAFLSSYYGKTTDGHITEPMGTQTGHDRHALVEGPAVAIEDCGFRMLQPVEIAAGMAFMPGYVVLGKAREQVQQCGQAVTPPAAQWLWERVLETLK